MSSFSILSKMLLEKTFNLSILKKNRIAWIDYLRGIAIILVVYRHALTGIERSGISIPSYLMTANMIFYSFRIPLFFIVSGLFISKSLQKRTIKQIVISKFDIILYPYLIWSFIQITLQLILSSYTNTGRTLIDYTYILYQPRSIDQFWYLPALFNVSILYIFFKTKLKLNKFWQLILGIILFFISRYFRNISIISDWMEFYLYFALGDMFSNFFFKEKIQTLFRQNYFLSIIIPLFIVTQIFYLSQDEFYYRDKLAGQTEFILISVIGCICMFAFAFWLQHKKILVFLRIVGFHSLFIYVLHVLASALIRLVFTKAFGIYDPTILLLSGIIFGVILPIIFYNLFVNKNILWFLFSCRIKNKPLTHPS